MVDWPQLPLELLAYVYTYLSSRDRLACSMVCQSWRLALDHVTLWKKTVVRMDQDLMEPSTTLLMRDYSKHIKTLEFGWTRRPEAALLQTHQELTKRAVRLFILLHDNATQIKCMKIFNWFDFCLFKKVVYHVIRFLKIQINLKSLVFDHINMRTGHYIKILSATSLGVSSTITHLDITSCHYYHASFKSIYFRSCIEQLPFLRYLKLDYFILSCNLIDSILISRNKGLQQLVIILMEPVWVVRTILDEKWCSLNRACPNLKVSLIIRNVYQLSEIDYVLKESIRLVSLSLIIPKDPHDIECESVKLLTLIVNLYRRTLQYLDVDLVNENETLDHVLPMIVRRCSSLKRIIFRGVLDAPQLSIEKINSFSCGGNLRLYPGGGDPADGVYSLRHKRVQLTWERRARGQTVSSLVYID